MTKYLVLLAVLVGFSACGKSEEAKRPSSKFACLTMFGGAIIDSDDPTVKVKGHHAHVEKDGIEYIIPLDICIEILEK